MIPGVVAQPHKGPASVHISIATPLRASASRSYARGKAIAVSTAASVTVNRSYVRGRAVLVQIGETVSQARKFSRGVITVIPIGQAIALLRKISKAIFVRQGIGILNPSLSSQAIQFLARTSGLDINHQNAYANLINGLVLDGVWPKLDTLYIFATQDQTTALTNLVSASYTGIAHGSPAFTADRGFTGVDASSSVWIDSTFNPTTAAGPNFATNSCHVSAWSHTNNAVGSSGGAAIGVGASGAANLTSLFPLAFDGKSYFRINDSSVSSGFTNTAGTALGHYVASRTGASASAGYMNGALVGSPNAAAGTLQNNSVFVLGLDLGSPTFGTANQLTMASIGGGLTATDVTKLFNRLSAYMGAIGLATTRATQAAVQVLESYSNPTNLRDTQVALQVLRTDT